MSVSNSIFYNGDEYIYSVDKKKISIMRQDLGSSVIVDFCKNLQLIKAINLCWDNDGPRSQKYEGPIDHFTIVAGQLLQENTFDME